MDGKSLDILEDKLSRLKEIIPEAFFEDKIDIEKLKILLCHCSAILKMKGT